MRSFSLPSTLMCGIDDSDQGPTWSWRWASSPNLRLLLLPRRNQPPCKSSCGPSEGLLFDPFTFALQSGFHLCCYVSVCTTDISATAENKHSPTTMGCNYLPCTVRYVFIIVCQELDDGTCYWSRLTGTHIYVQSSQVTYKLQLQYCRMADV